MKVKMRRSNCHGAGVLLALVVWWSNGVNSASQAATWVVRPVVNINTTDTDGVRINVNNSNRSPGLGKNTPTTAAVNSTMLNTTSWVRWALSTSPAIVTTNVVMKTDDTITTVLPPTTVSGHAAKSTTPTPRRENLLPTVTNGKDFAPRNNLPDLSLSTEDEIHSTVCEKGIHRTCNYTNFQRCVLIRERVPRCICLPGYALAPDGHNCIAVRHYRATFTILNQFTSKLLQTNSDQYRHYSYQAKEGLRHAIRESRIGPILVNIAVRRFSQTPDGGTAIHLGMLLPRPYAPPSGEVEEALREGILKVLHKRPTDNTLYQEYFLSNTTIVVSMDSIRFLQIQVPDPCADPLLNYCHSEAVCTETSTSGFTCMCKSGYEDKSPNRAEAPGEECTLDCECKNGGTCELDEGYDVVCRCHNWFLGVRCDLDGRVLLIALTCAVAAAVLIVTIVCAVCWKRNRHARRDQLTISSMRDRDIPLSPLAKGSSRTWVPDSWRYYHFSPPNYNELMYWQRAGATVEHFHPQSQTTERALRHHNGRLLIPRPHITQQYDNADHEATEGAEQRPDRWFWSLT